MIFVIKVITYISGLRHILLLATGYTGFIKSTEFLMTLELILSFDLK